MIMDAETRAKQAINYLTGTDALGSHDYIPEITTEFIRVWNTALEEAEEAIRLSVPSEHCHYMMNHCIAIINELKHKKRETTQ